jgi:hypothetical protein
MLIQDFPSMTLHVFLSCFTPCVHSM